MTAERDRWEGKGKEVVATMKEKAGEVTDDDELEAEGKAQKYDGKGQEAWGTVKEKACDLEEKVTE